MTDKINVYTPKQLEVMRMWQNNELKRINLLEGSVSSGKTWISLVLWAFWVATMPKDKLYLMCGKSLTTLKRNCLILLEALVGKENFTFSVSTKEGWLFGRKILLEGANDVRSESKIRGLSLQGAYCDELTLFPEDFFGMLLSRLRIPNAKAFLTTNPDTPNHWLYTKYIKRIDTDGLDMLRLKFLIDDNTTLDKDYIINLKKEYTGVFYDRFILGLWVVAEGAIYRTFSDNEKDFYITRDKLPHLREIAIGVDFGGNKSNHAFTATGFNDDFSQIYVLKSASINAAGTSVTNIINDFIVFSAAVKQIYGRVDRVYADCNEQAIINEMRSATDYSIYNSIKNEIIDRIRCTDILLATRRIHLVEGENKALADGLKNAVWDGNKFNDVRLDNGTSDIDILDSYEYSFEHRISQLTRGILFAN